MSALNDVKLLLGVSGTDLDAQLSLIIDNTENRLLAKLDGEAQVPDELSYIVTEVALARFNRIGSEGVSSHTVEGESLAWSKDDFAPYSEEIDSWLAAREDAGKGAVRFL